MVAVRAKPHTGFSSGKAQTIVPVVKPVARRSGLVTSRALQMVGVSHAVSRSRSAAEISVMVSVPCLRWSVAVVMDLSLAGRAARKRYDHHTSRGGGLGNSPGRYPLPAAPASFNPLPAAPASFTFGARSEEHTSELPSLM